MLQMQSKPGSKSRVKRMNIPFQFLLTRVCLLGLLLNISFSWLCFCAILWALCKVRRASSFSPSVVVA